MKFHLTVKWMVNLFFRMKTVNQLASPGSRASTVGISSFEMLF